MITTIIDENNKEHTITTQQYEVGLYVIVDNDPAQQFSLNATEEEYHKWLRENNNFNPNKSSTF